MMDSTIRMSINAAGPQSIVSFSEIGAPDWQLSLLAPQSPQRQSCKGQTHLLDPYYLQKYGTKSSEWKAQHEVGMQIVLIRLYVNFFMKVN